MHEAYRYVTVTGELARAHAVAADLASAGAVVVGLWAGAAGIGWWDDERVILAGLPAGVTVGAVGDADGVHVERLRAAARPTSIAPLAPGGIFAHRWFHFAATDWDELLTLSSEAWPAFEAAYGATIEGFFRSDDVEEGDGRVLLVTRYPSLRAWETSRGVLRNPDGDVAESGRRFMRRRELTRRSIVRTGVLLV